MGRYGKNMRDCCDSVAQPGTPHIVGCEGFELPLLAKVERITLEEAKKRFPPAALSPSGEK